MDGRWGRWGPNIMRRKGGSELAASEGKVEGREALYISGMLIIWEYIRWV